MANYDPMAPNARRYPRVITSKEIESLPRLTFNDGIGTNIFLSRERDDARHFRQGYFYMAAEHGPHHWKQPDFDATHFCLAGKIRLLVQDVGGRQITLEAEQGEHIFLPGGYDYTLVASGVESASFWSSGPSPRAGLFDHPEFSEELRSLRAEAGASDVGAAQGAARPRSPVALTGRKRWEYLARQKTIRLGTINEDGTIHLSPMWYVVDGTHIYIPIDNPGHRRNAESGRPTSGVVDAGDEYSTVTGVRFQGSLSAITDPGLVDRLTNLLLEKYAHYGHPHIEAMLEAGEFAGRAWHELVPDKTVGWDAREIAVPPAPEARRLPDFVHDRIL